MWETFKVLFSWLGERFKPKKNESRADFEAVMNQAIELCESLRDQVNDLRKAAVASTARHDKRETILMAKMLKVEQKLDATFLQYRKCEEDRLENTRKFVALELQNSQQEHEIWELKERIVRAEKLAGVPPPGLSGEGKI